MRADPLAFSTSRRCPEALVATSISACNARAFGLLGLTSNAVVLVGNTSSCVISRHFGPTVKMLTPVRLPVKMILNQPSRSWSSNTLLYSW